MEILITVVIVAIAGKIIYSSIKKKAAGQCDCGSCSSHCQNYKK